EARLLIASAEAPQTPRAEFVYTPDFDALRPLLAEDSVFAVPRVSWSGYPIKLLNAMAAGKAIVACESAAYPLLDRVSGLIVPDNDAAAFAEALHELVTNPKLRAELGRNARETILAEHRPDLVAEQIETLDLRLLGSTSES
ncbi:MAG TPA: glycosyltransferase family 4 protein, partial [Candidatus Hydrogenedentes bacterium]|nr:glycosyltransferase family 4 protein [Candidatus Hydrogenedentota bacterium]